MANYTVSSDNSISRIKADAKAEVIETILTALAEKYGEDNVKMVRVGGESKANEIGVVVGTATTEDGSEVPICVTANASAKDFIERTSAKGRVYPVFDFAAAVDAYESWIAERAVKAEAAAAKKASKD